MVALNSSQAAEGELYVDDGKSFQFLEGAFIHRRFVFANGQLTSINLATSPGKSQFSLDCIIERIVLLGYTGGSKSASIEPANQKVEIELGPIRLLGPKSPAVATTIRKPGVRISDDWTIKIL